LHPGVISCLFLRREGEGRGRVEEFLFLDVDRRLRGGPDEVLVV